MSGMFCILFVGRLMHITRETDSSSGEFPRELSRQRGVCKRRAMRLWREIYRQNLFRNHQSLIFVGVWPSRLGKQRVGKTIPDS